MKIYIKDQTEKQKAIHAMNDFYDWLLKIKNVHMADTKRMSEAYQKVWEENIKRKKDGINNL